MSSRTVTFDGAASFDGRGFSWSDCVHVARAACRIAAGCLINGFGAAAFVAVLAVVATLGAAWIVHSGLVSNGHVYSSGRTGPGTLALNYDPNATVPIARPQASVKTAAQFYARYVVKVPQDRSLSKIARAMPPVQTAKLDPVVTPKDVPAIAAPVVVAHINRVPLPHARPDMPQLRTPQPEVARAPVTEPAPKVVAAVVPAPSPAAVEKRAAPQESRPNIAMDTNAGARTAVYDIAAHTVYMPDGQRLEAHSGLYDKMDDPRYIKVRMRGPTPPNVYDLSLREQLFHGVRAIRLNPLDENRMHGRDGILAHTYMLGPNGQSNGCVSFKDYRKFLQTFLDGKVDRMVVVGDLGNTPWRTAAREGGTRSTPVRRYAAGFSRSLDDDPDTTGALSYAPERGSGTW